MQCLMAEVHNSLRTLQFPAAAWSLPDNAMATAPFNHASKTDKVNK